MKGRRRKDELLHVNLRSADASVVTLVMNFCPRSLWGCSHHREVRAAAPVGLGRGLLNFPGSMIPAERATLGACWGPAGKLRVPVCTCFWPITPHLQGCVGSRRTGCCRPTVLVCTRDASPQLAENGGGRPPALLSGL